MRDDDEFSEGQEEKILNKNSNNLKGNIINLGESDDDFLFSRPKNLSNKNSSILNDDNNNDNDNDNEINEERNIYEPDNFGDAPKCMASTSLFSKEFRDIDVKLLQNKSRRKAKNKTQTDIIKSKNSFSDVVSIKNFGKASSINAYLKENKESILKYLELFKLMETLGQEGQKQFERLEKLNPSNNNQDDSKSQISYNNDNNSNNNMEEVFNEFEIKKNNLIRIYKRIQSTVGSIYTFSNNNTDHNLIKDDVNYLDFNSKIYDNLLEEMFPLFDSIHSQTQHFAIANITKNLQKISDSLKENDIGFKSFFNFVQSLINRIPMGAIKGNNLCDILGDEKEEIKIRKNHFYDILNKEKLNLVNIIEPSLKYFHNNSNEIK
jgi:hypothetical protein